MSTRSAIIVEHAAGHWARVYCHFDGCLEGVGRTLQDHYNGQDLAEALVAPGDMSSLHPRCSKPPSHSFDKPVEGFTVYYGRDRGEEGTEPKTGPTLESVWPPEDTWTEYTYVWRF